MIVLLLLACAGPAGKPGDDSDSTPPVDSAGPVDTAPPGPDVFADAVVSFTPGEAAGFGQSALPDVVLGPPEASSGGAPSLDVLSLGREGEIILEFDDIGLIDGEGPDLRVFENPFTGFAETGRVALSEDGETWAEFPCDAEDAEGGFPGCAGVALVYANGESWDSMEDPGGDLFDLAELGLARARFVRVRDSGANGYEGTSGGFDLDAVAVIHGEALE
ncbi:MAG: cell surface protein [Alphaproteobacteria bacterium]|nr:cell surface protein [Alphaproteobacteria bacterium]MCB9796646.1 cell surface protein [Alphaproteobacteria bacterium]